MKIAKIAIVIPTYIDAINNRLDKLQSCLFSLYRQNVESEIIIVDDGSPQPYSDQISSLAMKYNCAYLRLQYSSKQYRIAQCMNAGFSITTAPICFFTPDDIIYPSVDFLTSHVFLHELYTNLAITAYQYNIPQQIDSLGMLRRNASIEEWVLLGQPSVYNYSPSTYSSLKPLSILGNHKLLGSFSIMRDNMLHKGLAWDNNYIGWGIEEVDFQRQLRLSGICNILVRDLLMFHLEEDKYANMADPAIEKKIRYFCNKWQLTYPSLGFDDGKPMPIKAMET